MKQQLRPRVHCAAAPPQRSAVVGSMTAVTSVMRLAGKPPCRACSRIASASGEVDAVELGGSDVALHPLDAGPEPRQDGARALGDPAELVARELSRAGNVAFDKISRHAPQPTCCTTSRSENGFGRRETRQSGSAATRTQATSCGRLSTEGLDGLLALAAIREFRANGYGMHTGTSSAPSRRPGRRRPYARCTEIRFILVAASPRLGVA
jgi:hypothetical protein